MERPVARAMFRRYVDNTDSLPSQRPVRRHAHLGESMITLCYAAKGGSGTTLVACVRALDSVGPALLVDLDGDIPAMLGLAEPDRPGVVDWLASDAPIAHLDDLLVDVTPNCALLPASQHDTASTVALAPDVAPERWDGLIDWLAEWTADSGGSVVVDAGTRRLPATFVEQCPRRWLVTRAGYLALRRAGRLPGQPTGVVLVDEPGHPLGPRDIETSTRAPIVATVDWDPRVNRSIDAGLLLGGRLPRSLHKSLARAAA